MAEFPPAAAAEKDQRDSLFELSGSRADLRRTVCGNRRADARMDFSSRFADHYGNSPDRCGYAYPADGNPLWQRVISAQAARASRPRITRKIRVPPVSIL